MSDTENVFNNFDFVVVNCGRTELLTQYLDNIREKAASIENITKHSIVVYIYEGGLNKCNMRKCGRKKDYSAIKNLLKIDKLFGSIGFRATTVKAAFDIVDILKNCKHCKNFSTDPYNIEVVKGEYCDRKIKILILYYDTDSDDDSN